MKKLTIKTQCFYFKETISNEKIVEWVNFQLMCMNGVIYEVSMPYSAEAELFGDTIHICSDDDYVVCTIEMIEPENAPFLND